MSFNSPLKPNPNVNRTITANKTINYAKETTINKIDHSRVDGGEGAGCKRGDGIAETTRDEGRHRRVDRIGPEAASEDGDGDFRPAATSTAVSSGVDVGRGRR